LFNEALSFDPAPSFAAGAPFGPASPPFTGVGPGPYGVLEPGLFPYLPFVVEDVLDFDDDDNHRRHNRRNRHHHDDDNNGDDDNNDDDEDEEENGDDEDGEIAG
jgi:hypothetical protein